MDILSAYLNQSTDEEDLIPLKDLATQAADEVIVLKHFNDTEIYYYASNMTLPLVDWRSPYKLVLDVLLLLLLIVIMLSVGCEITWENIFRHIKKPVGLFVGLLSQFGIMPFSAYCILLISGINGLHATAVLIISCCPAGTLSNTFTYFCDGDLPLSIAMTTASTIIAMGMMPLNLWVYGSHFETDTLIIPYLKMAMSLITVTSPTVVGMLIKWKFPRVAYFTTKIGGYCTILIMIICIGMEILLFPNMFTGIPPTLYVITLSLPAIGLTLGYGLAASLKRNKAVRRTIAIECGIQNVPVALTVMTLSFPLETQEEIVLFPWLYLFAMTTCCSIICLAYQLYKKYFKKVDGEIPSDEETRKEFLLEATECIRNINNVDKEMTSSTMTNGKQTYSTDTCI